MYSIWHIISRKLNMTSGSDSCEHDSCEHDSLIELFDPLEDFYRDLADHEQFLAQRIDRLVMDEIVNGSDRVYIFTSKYIPSIDIYDAVTQRKIANEYNRAIYSMHKKIRELFDNRGWNYRDDGASFKLYITREMLALF